MQKIKSKLQKAEAEIAHHELEYGDHHQQVQSNTSYPTTVNGHRNCDKNIRQYIQIKDTVVIYFNFIPFQINFK
ncbi:unnamed protein product [Arctia plantaginis]|uniref:Uncharacterized protein n=1 Tax=Arctia plantaginis TaxID=874455 RepID=A0A8S1AG80_ARCPL|nr:unnamed protein product [Arctia plantaginis]